MAHLQLIESKNMESNEAQMLMQETAGQQPVRTEAGKLQLHSSQTYMLAENI